MSRFDIGESRKRGKHLFIVEGEDEKNELMYLILKCFPEIDAELDNIWIHGTNIYLLYKKICDTYETEEWDDMDIDLPYVISHKSSNIKTEYKEDFTSIYLIFDFERQDPNFSKQKIEKMQEYFSSEEDVGKLYINYPMVESYQDLIRIPDSTYKDRKVSITMKKGSEYKNLVKKRFISKAVSLPEKMREILINRFGIDNPDKIQHHVDKLLDISTEANIDSNIENILAETIEGKQLLTAKGQFTALLKSMEYLKSNINYWTYMRSIFKQIIIHNICKANMIQNNNYEVDPSEYQSCFHNIDLQDILNKQCLTSQDQTDGYISVLNTSIFIIPTYNSNLIY